MIIATDTLYLPEHHVIDAIPTQAMPGLGVTQLMIRKEEVERTLKDDPEEQYEELDRIGWHDDTHGKGKPWRARCRQQDGER